MSYDYIPAIGSVPVCSQGRYGLEPSFDTMAPNTCFLLLDRNKVLQISASYLWRYLVNFGTTYIGFGPLEAILWNLDKPKASETEVYAQSEARFHRKPPQNNPPQYNRQGNNLAQPTDLLFILADLLNKFPGLAQQLPRIAAVKNNRNQKYAIIEALLESESYV
ncbi:hypothetical protein NPIL_440231 [Nephila pilipes]|uniref:Uncharacterized protein n=1 Tax=Nephila pilipes TaxID=299642 RepID=A0A8X6USU4_NEPPI|nr:hypothetical protein NPIL_440231 [Nephila pilipes]